MASEVFRVYFIFNLPLDLVRIEFWIREVKSPAVCLDNFVDECRFLLDDYLLAT